MRPLPWLLASCSLFLSISVTAWAQDPPAQAESHQDQRADMEDRAGILTPEERAQISGLLRINNEKGTSIVQVMILPQLPATESIEAAARSQLMDDLNVPGAKQERALLLVSMGDRKLRIATSAALRPSLPDTFCEEVIDNYILPRFRQGNFYQGILGGLEAIIGKLHGARFAVLPNPSLKRSANGRPPSPGRWYAVHFHRPGLGVLPSSPA